MAFIDQVMAGDVNLQDTEDYLRSIEDSIKTGWIHLAITLGSIKMYGLYLDVATNWKQYIGQQRTDLTQSKARQLAVIGENYLRYRIPMEENKILLKDNKEKMRLIKHELVRRDPMYWKRFKSFSVSQLKHYQDNMTDAYADVYIDVYHEPSVSIKGLGLYSGGSKIKGINLKEVCQKIEEGKRPYIIWIDDNEAEYKRLKRAIGKAGINNS